MPLTPEFKAKTIAALRGDKYKQYRHGIGDFQSKNLCCIGVAADVNGFDGSQCELTRDASDFIGLDYDEADDWIEWNDQEGLTFDQIADRIEAKY